MLLLLLLLPFIARAVWPSPYPTVALPSLACSQGPSLTAFIDDRSSSTYVTDPGRRRQPEMRQIMRWLDEADCDSGDSVAIAQFDDVIAPLNPTVIEGRLEAVLAAMPDSAPQSSSSLGPAAWRAVNWANSADVERRSLLIATDGVLSDFDDAFAALEQFPGAVYVLALGGELPAEWAGVDLDGVVVLENTVRFGDIARSFASLINSSEDGTETS